MLHSIIRFVPNAITILSLSLGLLSMRYSFECEWQKAIMSIMLAGMCDLLDGRVARIMKSESMFGKELDSLADLVNFGVSPAILLYLYQLYEFNKIGWIACQIFVICQALRLARFNSGNYYHSYFVGVPSPAGALLLLMPIITFCCFGIKLSSVVILIYSILVSLSLISTLKTPSLKEINLKKHAIILVILCVVFVSDPWFTIWSLLVLYMGLIIAKNYKRIVYFTKLIYKNFK